MKIFARMEGRKWLLEVSTEELRELNPDVEIEIGAEYDTLKAAQTLMSLRSLSRNKMAHAKKQIDELQKFYSSICDNHDDVMLLDTIANLKKDDLDDLDDND
jgi:hypothetical protein